jgi:non-ribosomal peptide synthase protein (TIGR01720 family)
MSRTVGWFTVLVPLWLPVPDAEEAQTTFARALGALESVRPHKHSWEILRAVDERVAALPEPLLALNYLGQADRERHGSRSGVSVKPLYGPTADWNVLEGRFDPTLNRAVLLDVEVVVVEGRLSAHFAYSRNRHRRDSVAALADAFRDELTAAVSELATVA